MSWNGRSLYMHLIFISRMKLKNWCSRVNACICLLCVWEARVCKLLPDPLDRQYSTISLYFLCAFFFFPPSWFFPRIQQLVWSNCLSKLPFYRMFAVSAWITVQNGETFWQIYYFVLLLECHQWTSRMMNSCVVRRVTWVNAACGEKV